MLRNELYQPWFVGEKDWGFEIIDGEYRGSIIQIEKLDFPNEDSNELALDYHVITKPESPSIDQTSETFKAVIELIVNDILREAIDEFKQTRDNDSKESGPQ
jgi:hypothetical protein